MNLKNILYCNKMYLNRSLNELKTDWKKVISGFDFTEINKYLNEQEQEHKKIYPPKELVFNCFNQFHIKETKVLILGLDPYIREGQAMGLSFSVPEGVKVPPSLRNIFKEINRSLNKNKERKNGNLTNWAKQGILLLNTALTVLEGKTGSHKKIWNSFTEYILSYINKSCEPIVFLLWGRDAEKYRTFVNEKHHTVLVGGHPSPLNRRNPFIGNNHFVLCNKKLQTLGKELIEW